MTDLRKNQGPLTHLFTPPNEHMQIVTEVVELHGKPGGEYMNSPEYKEDGNLADVLHFADWGSIEAAMTGVAAALEAHPDTRGILRFMRKEDGEVLHVLYINMDPPAAEKTVLDAAQVRTIRRLLRYYWRDIDFAYNNLTAEERGLVSPKEFDALAEWVKQAS